MIPQRNISLISNTLMSAGGRRIPEAVIERDYVLAWFLTGLAGHPLREVLAFKGGTALRRCWFEDYRFSEDLDFTLTRPITLEKILAGLSEIFATVAADSGLRIAFDREDRHGHQNSHTFYLRYQGPLPAANDVKVDITINEVLCFPLQDRPIQRTYDSFDDLPEGPTVKVYAIEEIAVEKLLALRQRIIAGMEQAIAAKEDRLRRLWTARLAHQMNHLPPFDDVFREVLRAVRAADLPKADG